MKLLTFFCLVFLQTVACQARCTQSISLEKQKLAEIDTLGQLDTASVTVHFHLPYNLADPMQRFEMPETLKEISGLSMSNDGSNKWLMAIQDEEGMLYYINKNTGLVEKEMSFYKRGDYEGIEVVGDVVYVVKSTGTIYEVKNLEETPPYVKKHKFFLSKDNDVEGLTYDPKENRLLIACKGMAITGESTKHAKYKKAVYSYYLDDDRMDLKPTYVFSLESIQDFLKKCKATKNHKKLCDYFKPEVENLIFSPSAIAIHPKTGNLYMTSSAKKILMVFDQAGNILHLEKMNKMLHPQPEGLTFDEDGTLYIASEGKKGTGTILRFSYVPEMGGGETVDGGR